jgi:hypothetical protein
MTSYFNCIFTIQNLGFFCCLFWAVNQICCNWSFHSSSFFNVSV